MYNTLESICCVFCNKIKVFVFVEKHKNMFVTVTSRFEDIYHGARG